MNVQLVEKESSYPVLHGTAFLSRALLHYMFLSIFPTREGWISMVTLYMLEPSKTCTLTS